MATSIFTRSPRIITVTGTAGDATKIELYLYNSPASAPANPQYTLSRDIIDTDVYYDISPYCREYIAHTSFTDMAQGTAAATVTEYAYCQVKVYKNAVLQSTTTYLCFDGYGYHEDGYNPTPDEVMLDEGEYYVLEASNSGSVYVNIDGGGTWTATYTGLTSGGTTNVNITDTVGHLPLLLNTDAGYKLEGNTLEIKKNGTTQKTFTVTTVCEPKYTPIECDFVNAYGVWQRIMFFKVSKDSLEVRSDEYKRYPSAINYTVADNIVQNFNTNGTLKVTANTGFVPESYSGVIKQLLLSEKVLLDGVAVKVDTKSVELFKHINDKNINYQIDFLHSHDIINYVL